MTRLTNDSAAFADEALGGFAAANGHYARQVRGGVVRATASPRGQVAVVVGGGSGHYPAFAGWVGPGFAHGAACGNIFASPSASQIYSVARHAENGGGVIFAFGNYTGDKIHFGLAAEQLRRDGIDARIVTVTDDIASSQGGDRAQRRGIAGDLVVLKMLCAAAEAGLGIDVVERVARKANEATSTLGIAFSGCTLPGADAPLFTVPVGKMAVGMGIHGERGISEKDMGSADEVASVLFDAVLADQAWRAGDKVALILNGLGTTKYEELFVVYQSIARRLEARRLTPVNPLVGEYVTSLDMSGLSLTMTRLDDELARYWTAPCDTPAFKMGSPLPPRDERPAGDFDPPPPPGAKPGSEASQRCALRILHSLQRAKEAIVANAEYLGRLDSVAGDGDHGIGMVRGATAALQAAEQACGQRAGAQSTLARAADACAEHAGGTSGAIWGVGMNAVARTFGDEMAVTDADIVTAARAFIEAIVNIGGARVGDKTIVDAAVPFTNVLEQRFQASHQLAESLAQAVAAARDAAQRTASFSARMGRARAHGDQSIGTADPGATSFALIVSALAEAAKTPAQGQAGN